MQRFAVLLMIWLCNTDGSIRLMGMSIVLESVLCEVFNFYVKFSFFYIFVVSNQSKNMKQFITRHDTTVCGTACPGAVWQHALAVAWLSMPEIQYLWYQVFAMLQQHLTMPSL